MAFQLIQELKQVLPGFDYFKFEAVGEKHRLLKVCFRNEENGEPIEYHFGELSDGQRMLIVLYTLLYSALSDSKSGCTLCLDEPENFLAMSEIQPWLTQLYDACIEGKLQALLISHHPEFMNYLLASPPSGFWFERQSNRPVRVKPIVFSEQNVGIPASELIARGWVDG
jgi:predicted ATPase